MTDARPKPNPAEVIYREARTARETSQQLLPLLSLLEEEPNEGGSLDEIRGLLTAILEALRHQGETLDRLASASTSVSPPAPSPDSTSAC